MNTNTVQHSLHSHSPKEKDEEHFRSSTLNTLPIYESSGILNRAGGPSSVQHANMENSSSSSMNNSNKKQRQKLVLSTSFLSTKRLENGPASPASPLQGKRATTGLNKALQALKSEISQLQQQLNETRRSKENAEHVRDSTGSEIYSGAYSTDHLQKHSMRIRANTQIRELEKSIKKFEKQIGELRQQFEHTKKSRELYSARDRPKLPFSREEVMGGAALRSPQESFQGHPLVETLVAHDSPLEHEDTLTLRTLNNQQEGALSDDHLSDVPTESDEDEPNTKNIETATWLVCEYMESLQDKKTTTDFVLKKSNGLVALLKQHPEIRSNLLLDSFMYTIQSMLLNEDKVVVSCGYRICRYLIDGEEFIQEMLRLHIDACLIMSFAKDFSYQMEREQALRVVRTFLEYRVGITNGVMQAVISCIEKQDDPLKNMAIETLLELCFVRPEVVSECHGMRVLEAILEDPPFPMASLVLDTILQLMSMHATRVHFLNDFDISVLVTSFSDTNTKSALNVEKMQNTCLLISKALKDYNGLMLFSMNNFKPLKELLSFFQIPMCAQYLIDIFLDVLRIKQLSFDKNKSHFKQVSLHFSRESIILNQHIAFLILMMYHSDFGLQVWALIEQGKKDQNVSSALISRGRLLLIEYINLAANLLDINVLDVKGIPSTWNQLIYDETYQFGKMTYVMNRTRNNLGVAGIDYGKPVKSFSENLTLNREVDDFKFRKLVLDSRVLQTKEFSLWNWTVIQELLEGPLLNEKYLDELVKSTKFIRRLLIFYRPLRMRFANVNQGSRLSQRYVQAGCQFFHMLTSSNVGMRIFMDDTKIIPQLASLLFRAMEGHTVGNIFNLKLLSTKMVVGYFKFIGVLTKSGSGISVLKRWNFFTVIYKMFQPNSRISSMFLLLTLPELDLRYSPHCRTIMGKALVNSDRHTRIKATEYMGEKLKKISCLEDSLNRDSEMSKDSYLLRRYLVEMLTRQLYDLSSQVVAVADQALYEYAVRNGSSKTLGSSLQNSLNQLVFIRSPIIFELLGTKNGFQLLNEINFVQEERKSWLATKNREYVFLVENFLNYNQHGTFSTSSRRMAGIDRLPQHLYESLAKTEDGITLISKSRDLTTFISVIKSFRQTLKSPEDPPINDVINLKSALWCVGYIGSTTLGVRLLDEYGVVEDIIQIAYYASITSARFTALLALGLISKTSEGCEILDEMGWNCCLNVQGSPMGITFPNRLDKFLSYNEKRWVAQGEYHEPIIEFDSKFGRMLGDVKPINLNLGILLNEKTILENPLEDSSLQDMVKMEEGYYAKSISAGQQHQYNNEEEKVVDEVLAIVSQLGNHILSGNAIKGITELNKKYGPSLFEGRMMFYKILDMMAEYRFKPHVRKFLCGLFINKKALENIIKNEKRKTNTMK